MFRLLNKSQNDIGCIPHLCNPNMAASRFCITNFRRKIWDQPRKFQVSYIFQSRNQLPSQCLGNSCRIHWYHCRFCIQVRISNTSQYWKRCLMDITQCIPRCLDFDLNGTPYKTIFVSVSSPHSFQGIRSNLTITLSTSYSAVMYHYKLGSSDQSQSNYCLDFL